MGTTDVSVKLKRGIYQYPGSSFILVNLIKNYKEKRVMLQEKNSNNTIFVKYKDIIFPPIAGSTNKKSLARKLLEAMGTNVILY